MVKDNSYNKFRTGQREHDDAFIDPVYKMFLENVKKERTSYVLKLKNGDNGFPASVKYERKIKSKADVSFKGKGKFENDERPTSGMNFPESSKRSGTSLNRFEIGEHLMDESYLTFLRHSSFDGKSVFLECEPGVIIRYEAQRETSASSKRLKTKAAHNHHHRKISGDRKGSGSNDFERQLRIVVNKPFDHNEYKELLREATERKQLCKVKHLRGTSISYATEELSKSYLDHYPELARQINSTDSHKALKLLRGFFFWLELATLIDKTVLIKFSSVSTN
ncbi:hypothetical protein J5N97_022360 [Dioscorea zingiberensis]|uniref:Uncharacterized protein n=1 Tax=Dioscorea zingiberensis TaxID=325984 RepID=A0A9D5HAX5_9LILI|nr:hypothetical protein J5N97_022360 [Dioscorea zingiberensis]